MRPVQISITRKTDGTYHIVVQNELETIKSFDAHANTLSTIIGIEAQQLVPPSNKVHVR